MKEFKELSSYKNRGNSYIFIPNVNKYINREYKQPFVFVPNEICPESPHGNGYILYSSWVYTPYKAEKKIQRNSPCPCGSGKKYKKCCLT